MGETNVGQFPLFKKAILTPATVTVLVFALIGSLTVESETVKEQFPLLVEAQLYFHRFLSVLTPGSMKVRAVTIVGVDDDAFWSEPVNGSQPTNRRYLADSGHHRRVGGSVGGGDRFPVL